MTVRRRRGGDCTVRARFSVREAPGITVHLSHGAGGDDAGPTAVDANRSVGDAVHGALLADAARRTAQRVLAEAGRGYLGGRVELCTPRPSARSTCRPPARGPRGHRAVRRAADRAVALAVAATLRGDPVDSRVRVRPPL
ncbi:hypothetical protein [Streptomyces sp. NPDC058872]|uniref:hypothetical protein n=1 Tax=Streptomyces sp. NPDC058872 TaxID=3346661 RepID=UPI00368CC55A